MVNAGAAVAFHVAASDAAVAPTPPEPRSPPLAPASRMLRAVMSSPLIVTIKPLGAAAAGPPSAVASTRRSKRWPTANVARSGGMMRIRVAAETIAGAAISSASETGSTRDNRRWRAVYRG